MKQFAGKIVLQQIIGSKTEKYLLRKKIISEKEKGSRNKSSFSEENLLPRQMSPVRKRQMGRTQFQQLCFHNSAMFPYLEGGGSIKTEATTVKITN